MSDIVGSHASETTYTVLLILKCPLNSLPSVSDISFTRTTPRSRTKPAIEHQEGIDDNEMYYTEEVLQDRSL